MTKNITKDLTMQEKEIIAVFFALLSFIKDNKEQYIKLLLNYLHLEDIEQLNIDYQHEENTRELLSLFILKNACLCGMTPPEYLNAFSSAFKEIKKSSNQFDIFLKKFFLQDTSPVTHEKLNEWMGKVDQDKNKNKEQLKKLLNHNKFSINIGNMVLDKYIKMIVDNDKAFKRPAIGRERLLGKNRNLAKFVLALTIFIALFIVLLAGKNEIKLLLHNLKFMDKDKDPGNYFYTALGLIAILLAIFYVRCQDIQLTLNRYFTNETKKFISTLNDFLKNMTIEDLKEEEIQTLNITYPKAQNRTNITDEETSNPGKQEEDQHHLTQLLGLQTKTHLSKRKKSAKPFPPSSALLLQKFSLTKKSKREKEEEKMPAWAISDKTFAAGSDFIKPVRGTKNQYICLPEKIATQLKKDYSPIFDALLRLIQDIPLAAKTHDNGLHKTEDINISLIDSNQQNSKEPKILKSNINIKYIANGFTIRIWCVMHHSKENNGNLYIPVVIEQHVPPKNKTYDVDLKDYSSLMSIAEQSFSPIPTTVRL